ncbi:MAG: DUF4115 domain-containing protein [Actinomycetota bacterium]|nr:DUF4115 domain-containing protein [Actinomycetota bacterium]
MTPVLIAVIAAVAVVLTVVSARRGLAERDAVERHHRTLDALGSLTARPATPTDPPAPRAIAPRDPGTTPPRDALATAPRGAQTRVEYQPQHRKLRPPPNRMRAFRLVGVASLVVLVLGAGGYLVVRGRGGTASSQAHRRPAPPTTVAAPNPTPTSAPNSSPVVLVSSDTQQARYRVSRPSVDVELVPTALCWIEIKSALGHGPVLFSGTLRPGGRRPVPTGADTGGVSILLGNPAGMSVSVNGTALAFPKPSGAQPFTLLFQPPG